MTRFDAADPTERRKLYVDAIAAHRKRGSEFLTLEVDAGVFESDDEIALEGGSEGGGEAENGTERTDDAAPAIDPELGVPWIQFGDGTINLDCTDEELEALKELLGEFPAFKIDEITRPEEVDGVNVRVSAKADANRIAQCLDAIFRRVYGLPEAFRVWVVDL